MERRALEHEARMRRQDNLVLKSLDQARFPDPCLAAHQDELAGAGDSKVPEIGQPAHFLAAPNEWRRASSQMGRKPARHRTLSENSPRLHRSRKSLKLLAAQVLEFEDSAQKSSGCGRNGYLAGSSPRLQASGQIRCFSNDCLFLGSAFADKVADDHRPCGNADPTGKLRSVGSVQIGNTCN